MRIKRNLEEKAIIFGLVLIICLLQTISAKSSCNIQLDVPSGLGLSLQTDNESYEKGQCIIIFGNITNVSDEIDLLGYVKITLEYEDWGRYTTTTLQDNSYEYLYNISYGDPDGLWNITVEIETEQGNNVCCYKNVNVSLPSDIMRYKIAWFSPSDEAIYYRGSTFDISVFITEDDDGVTNASASCILPSMEKVELSEIKQGYYSGSYFIPLDSQTGIWSLSVESIKGSESSLAAGGSNLEIQIKPASLNLDILEQSSNEYILGDPMEIKVHLGYPAGDDIEDAAVTVKIADENLTLNSEGSGVYSVNFTTVINNVGSRIVEFSAFDQFGNSGSATQIIYIVERVTSEFPYYQILGFIIVIIISVLVVIFIKKRFSLLHLKDIESEKEELLRLQNETVTNYYIKGSISRETYDILIREYAERLAELGKKHPKKEKISRVKKIKSTRRG